MVQNMEKSCECTVYLVEQHLITCLISGDASDAEEQDQQEEKVRKKKIGLSIHLCTNPLKTL